MDVPGQASKWSLGDPEQPGQMSTHISKGTGAVLTPAVWSESFSVRPYPSHQSYSSRITNVSVSGSQIYFLGDLWPKAVLPWTYPVDSLPSGDKKAVQYTVLGKSLRD